MEQAVGAGLAPAQDTPPAPLSRGEIGAKPALKEIDRLKLERLNLSIGNLNLQLALLNEKARAMLNERATLQTGTACFHAEREGLVKEIVGAYCNTPSLDGKWRLNPDTMIFEAVGAGLAPARKEG